MNTVLPRARMPRTRSQMARRVPHLDALLQVRLLQLHANRLLQRVDVADGIEPQYGHRSTIGPPQALDALHRRGLASPVGPDEAEDLAVVHVERHVVDGDEAAVRLANAVHMDDGTAHFFLSLCRPFELGLALPCCGASETMR